MVTDGRWATAPHLVGRHVALEPLGRAHVPELRAALGGSGLWELVFTSVPHPDAVDGYVDDALAMQTRGEALPFAVRDGAGEIVGSTRFYQLAPAVPRLAIGYTWIVPRAQRTVVNTAAKRLLLGHAFEGLGCAAVAFETSTLNLRSQAAIERLGARRDGVLRSHMRHRDGTLRDTVVYSIVAGEWPAVRDALDARLEAARPPERADPSWSA